MRTHGSNEWASFLCGSNRYTSPRERSAPFVISDDHVVVSIKVFGDMNERADEWPYKCSRMPKGNEAKSFVV